MFQRVLISYHLDTANSPSVETQQKSRLSGILLPNHHNVHTLNIIDHIAPNALFLLIFFIIIIIANINSLSILHCQPKLYIVIFIVNIKISRDASKYHQTHRKDVLSHTRPRWWGRRRIANGWSNGVVYWTHAEYVICGKKVVSLCLLIFIDSTGDCGLFRVCLFGSGNDEPRLF
jgi:hypothetical protein